MQVHQGIEIDSRGAVTGKQLNCRLGARGQAGSVPKAQPHWKRFISDWLFDGTLFSSCTFPDSHICLVSLQNTPGQFLWASFGGPLAGPVPPVCMQHVVRERIEYGVKGAARGARAQKEARRQIPGDAFAKLCPSFNTEGISAGLNIQPVCSHMICSLLNRDPFATSLQPYTYVRYHKGS